ncbi:MAG: hypothetical protein KKA60_14930 [Proteobacteria bacterium]|nr:hypothetical protein [Pseudomonadota bacterium]
MKRSWCAATVFAALLAFFPAAAGAELRLALDAGIGYMGGDASFEIGKVVNDATGQELLPFPISRLEYPLDLVMATVRGELSAGDRWSFHLEARKDLDDGSEPAKDSDWFYYQGSQVVPPLVYSETEVEVDAWVVDSGVRYAIYQGYHRGWDELYGRKPAMRWSYGLGLGYQYRKLDYDENNLDQWYPLIPSLPHDRVPGAVAVYEVRHDIPYAEIFVNLDYKDRLTLEVSLGGSAFAHVEDKGHWLLRGLVFSMDSDWDGEAVMGSVRAKYRFTDHWFTALTLDMEQVNTSSESTSFSPATGHYSIGAETSSGSWFVGLTAGYRFGGGD